MKILVGLIVVLTYHIISKYAKVSETSRLLNKPLKFKEIKNCFWIGHFRTKKPPRYREGFCYKNIRSVRLIDLHHAIILTAQHHQAFAHRAFLCRDKGDPFGCITGC